MIRYRLVDPEGVDLGPFASSRDAFRAGDTVARAAGEDLTVVQVIAAEAHDPFAAYLVVRPTESPGFEGRKTRTR